MTRTVKEYFYPVRVVLLFFCIPFLMMACTETDTGQSGQLEEVIVGFTASYQGEAATFVAKDQGYFKENGLAVTLQPNASGKESLHNLLNGDVQIAHVAETPVTYAIMDTTYYQGIPKPSFQIFADMIYSNRVQKIIARKDHGIYEPLDIVGKRVAVLNGTQLDYFFDSFLLEHQITVDEFEVIEMPPLQQVEALKNGDIDVAVLWEPYATYIQHDLAEHATFLDTDLTYSTLWMATTLDSYAEAHPGVLVAYLKSLKMAQDYIHEHPDYTQHLLAEKFGVPVEVIQSLWTEMDFELSISERMLTLLEEQARWIMRNNQADTTIQNMKNLINFTPMQEVHPGGITVVK